MKVVILAGGLGTRLGEESIVRPKPLVEIGDKPMLWHIMKIYSHFGFNEFIICLGYKGHMVKEYFYHHFLYHSNITIDLAENKMECISSRAEPWKAHLIDTGLNTMTGGRIKRLKKFIGNETFMMTYGDGVGDINIPALLKFHQKNKKIVTLTAVQPLGRFGALTFDKKSQITKFQEKPKGDSSWINGGFYVVEPEIFDYIPRDQTNFEHDILEILAQKHQIAAYKHQGFWKCMDHPRDKAELEDLWHSGRAGWKIWKD